MVALPQIGCGIGGLAWDGVATVLTEAQTLAVAGFEVWIFQPRMSI